MTSDFFLLNGKNRDTNSWGFIFNMDTWEKVDFSLYPKTMRELTEHIGESGARALVRNFRGQRLYIPKHVKEDHPFVEILGIEAYKNLSFALGGGYITVPLCKAITNHFRNQEIQSHRKQGWSFSSLISHYDLSVSSLKIILN